MHVRKKILQIGLVPEFTGTELPHSPSQHQNKIPSNNMVISLLRTTNLKSNTILLQTLLVIKWSIFIILLIKLLFPIIFAIHATELLGGLALDTPGQADL